ncbi:polyprenyl synthetase family protein [bacterium]|nr:MAG: polyprenyl synthetase family protein [bacterium]
MKSEFVARLGQYKQLIERVLSDYIEQTLAQVAREYGSDAADVTKAFLDILGRGGKRMRGSLVLAGYELGGGQNQAAAIQLAMALEITHAYLLMIDDIQDRSDLRRGGPTAHIALQQRFRHGLAEDEAAHVGMALTLNAALYGAHSAQIVVSQLDAPADVRLALIQLVNQSMMATAHGQSYDLIIGLRDQVSYAAIEQVMELKSGEYSIMNPLAAGLTLAEASPAELKLIHDYALPTGLAFQLSDDIISTFRDEAETGKPAKSDIQEGKWTALIAFAVEQGAASDVVFLRSCLGSADLSDDDFEHCRTILRKSGSLHRTEELLTEYVQRAESALSKSPQSWPRETVEFLRSIAQYMRERAIKV